MEQNTEFFEDSEQSVISHEIAEKEVKQWLANKGIRKRKVEESADTIEILVEAVQDGDISFGDDGRIEQLLSHPIGDNADIKKLVYNDRISLQQVRDKLKGLKSNDLDGRVLAYVASATNKPIPLLNKIDTSDWSLAQSIAVFFM